MAESIFSLTRLGMLEPRLPPLRPVDARTSYACHLCPGVCYELERHVGQDRPDNGHTTYQCSYANRASRIAIAGRLPVPPSFSAPCKCNTKKQSGDGPTHSQTLFPASSRPVTPIRMRRPCPPKFPQLHFHVLCPPFQLYTSHSLNVLRRP